MKKEINRSVTEEVRRCLGRRQFLEFGALGSAALVFASTTARGIGSLSSGKNITVRADHGAFQSLAPGEISAQGWLHLYLQKQAQQLAFHLPEVSWPFTGSYWSGEESAPTPLAWWPWEQKAYWLDGALRCALVLQDEQLLQRAHMAVDYTLKHALSDGYLGPEFARYARELKVPAWDNFRWPHTIFFRALAAHGEATRDPTVAAAVRRHYLADQYRVPYGGPSRDVTNVEGMLWAFEQTGDRNLLLMAEKAWNDFLHSAPPGDRESGDLHPDRVYANTPIHAHGVTYIEKAKLPAILYMYTGKPEYLRFALAAQERIFSHHMLIDGIPSTAEDYRQTSSIDAHETCDISDHTWSWGYLLMATGDGVWGDRIERACFNAGLGAIKKDWIAVQYFSSPNQFIATQDSSHVNLAENDEGGIAYRPNPGHDSACCGGNVHRLFPNYVIRMWMTDSTGGLVATLYGASTVGAKVGPHRNHVEIREETNYPFEDVIRFTLKLEKPVAFPLSLRIPAWCKAPQLALNGEAVTLPPIHKGFIRLERTFNHGDLITLTLPMQPAATYWPNNGVALEHGPLVYSLSVKEEWSPVVTPQWSTAEFPEWDARPTTGWNYGLGVTETELLSQVRVERRPMTEDPWINPPIYLTVPLRKVSGWELHSDPMHPERKQTPQLPEYDREQRRALAQVDTERIALVPYGATHLRLTIFPHTV